MKGLLKNLGVILIILAAVTLVACQFTGNVNENAILSTSLIVMILGLLLHIYLNKKIVE